MWRGISSSAYCAHRAAYRLCLWTSHPVHLGIPHPGQYSVDRVIPLALHWHWIFRLLVARFSDVEFSRQNLRRSTPIPPPFSSAWAAIVSDWSNSSLHVLLTIRSRKARDFVTRSNWRQRGRAVCSSALQSSTYNSTRRLVSPRMKCVVFAPKGSQCGLLGRVA